MIRFSTFLNETREPKKTEEGHVILSEPLHFKNVIAHEFHKDKDGHVILQNALHFKNISSLKEENLQSLPMSGDYDSDSTKNRKLNKELAKNHKSMIDKDTDHISHYTSFDNANKNTSKRLNHALIKGKPLNNIDKQMHEAIHRNAKPTKMELHLYSGTKHDFSEMAKHSKDGIIHSPAHISASHSPSIAHDFASGAVTSGGPKASKKDLHIVHIHVKPHHKILHVSHLSHYEQEHESIIPSGAKLKYSHTTSHKEPVELHNGKIAEHSVKVHHFDIHSQE